MLKSGKPRRVIVACFVLVAASITYSQAAKKSINLLRVAGIQAKLFYETNGNFSADVFSGQVNLWNTVMEGASREGASSSMLVVVEVQASSVGSIPAGRRVQLIARYRIEDGSVHGKAAFFNKTMKVNIGSEGKFFSGFWLYETGCYPVELTARIVGQKASLRKKINLGCGE